MDEVIKRRVIGAAVLVALGILLPFMVIKLLQPGAPPAGESVRVYVITPNGEARPVQGQGGAPAQQPQTAEASAKAKADAKQALAQTVAPGNNAAAEQASEQQPESLSEAIAEHGTGEDAAADTVSAPNSATRLKPVPEPRPKPERTVVPAAESAAAGSHWVVQVGSFLEEDNAIGLMRRLASDYPAFYRESQVSGRIHYRVRVGPYDDVDKAGQIADELRGRGRNAQVLRAD